eukprot:594739-Rhodomonas_salina.2
MQKNNTHHRCQQVHRTAHTQRGLAPISANEGCFRHPFSSHRLMEWTRNWITEEAGHTCGQVEEEEEKSE